MIFTRVPSADPDPAAALRRQQRPHARGASERPSPPRQRPATVLQRRLRRRLRLRARPAHPRHRPEWRLHHRPSTAHRHTDQVHPSRGRLQQHRHGRTSVLVVESARARPEQPPTETTKRERRGADVERAADVAAPRTRVGDAGAGAAARSRVGDSGTRLRRAARLRHGQGRGRRRHGRRPQRSPESNRLVRATGAPGDLMGGRYQFTQPYVGCRQMFFHVVSGQ